MNVSDYMKLNRSRSEINNFRKEIIKTKVRNGIVKGFKIHKLNHKVLIDKKLQGVLENLYTTYGNYIVDTYNNLSANFSPSFSKQILKRFYVYDNKNEERIGIDVNLKDCVYLIEFEIGREDSTVVGDKFTNRYAGKGVCSLILPDELRPITVQSDRPLDLLFNPFSVYSRMNLGQILDGSIAKTVMFCDENIKRDPDSVKETLSWLNENVIKYLSGNPEYYERVNNEIINKLDNQDFKHSFLNDINRSHLYIEGPCFSHINMRKIQESIINPNEDVIIKKETIRYIADKLKLVNDFVITDDVIRRNIFCCPMYVNKLYKLTKSIINSRDFGAVKDVTQQPLRGRAQGGGSRLGQMEIEALLSSGCELSVKEFLTVKSDHSEEKRKLVKQVVDTGQYEMSKDLETIGRTKKVVSTILNFLKE